MLQMELRPMGLKKQSSMGKYQWGEKRVVLIVVKSCYQKKIEFNQMKLEMDFDFNTWNAMLNVYWDDNLVIPNLTLGITLCCNSNHCPHLCIQGCLGCSLLSCGSKIFLSFFLNCGVCV